MNKKINWISIKNPFIWISVFLFYLLLLETEERNMALSVCILLCMCDYIFRLGK